jgi:RHS repeat-associated protein
LTYADADQTDMTAAGTTALRRSLLGPTISTTSGTDTYWVRDNHGALVRRKSGSTTHYYLYDGLGSMRGYVATNGTLQASYRYTYEPFGLQTSGAPPVADPWRFAMGYDMRVIDGELNLTKFGTRYYDTTIGRWIQADPIAGSVRGPATMNRYAYVGRDPINQSDPTGADWWNPFSWRKECVAGWFDFGAGTLGLGVSGASLLAPEPSGLTKVLGTIGAAASIRTIHQGADAIEENDCG